MIDKGVVVLFAEFGHSVTEIAKKLGITHGRVSQILKLIPPLRKRLKNRPQGKKNLRCELCERLISKRHTVSLHKDIKLKVCLSCLKKLQAEVG